MQSAHFTQERPTGCGNFVLVRLRLKTDPSSCFILCCSLFAASSFDSSTSSMWSETRSLLSQRSVTYWERCLSFSLSILFSLSLSLCLSVGWSVGLSVRLSVCATIVDSFGTFLYIIIYSSIHWPFTQVYPMGTWGSMSQYF